MASESRFVLYAAFAGNLAVAGSKFVAAALSGSSAMLTEAVHSSADTFNQLVLLVGDRRSRRPADEAHPFGHGGEIYFFAFIVAVMVLLAGGAASIAQGWIELRDPHPIASLPLSLGVLGLSAVFEGVSLVIGYRASRRMIARHPGDGRPVSTWKFIRLSKDPNLYETLLEDTAALAGVAIAAVGVLGSAIFGLLWMDGAASIAIGLVLIADAYVIAYATRSLIAGEAATPALRFEIDAALRDAGFAEACGGLKTLHLGPETILAIIRSPPRDEPAGAYAARVEAMRGCVCAVDDRIQHVFFDLG